MYPANQTRRVAALSQEWVGEYKRDVAALAMKVCYANKHNKSELDGACSQFYDKYEAGIIEEAVHDSGAGGSQIKEAISGLGGFIPKAEFLIAMHETAGLQGSLEALTGRGFLEGLKRLDPIISGSLLYTIAITGNFADLTDKRFFTDRSAWFLNSLDRESASGLFSSAANTGNVGLLTSGGVMSEGMLGWINSIGEMEGDGNPNARLVGDILFLLADTGNMRLADPDFLRGLSSLPPAIAAQYITTLLIYNGDKALTSGAIMEKLHNSELDIRRDAMHIIGGNSDAPTILIANPGETHDRNLVLIIKDLRAAGYKVIYTGELADYREIAKIAKSEGVQAVGFGIRTDISTHAAMGEGVVADTLREMKVLGVGNVVTFVGKHRPEDRKQL